MGRNERGFALLSVVTIVGALLVAGIAAVKMTRSELRSTADSVAYRKAFYVAEGGVQRALARLSQERATASTSTAYTFTESDQPLGGGTYDVTVVQDPLYPSTPSRKQITAVGLVDGQQATVVNHTVVQDAPPPTICFTGSGTCRIESVVAAATDLFAGEIFSNNDVEIATSVGLLVRGSGNIYARNQFRDEGLTVAGISALGAVLSQMNANLYAGQAYTPSGLLSSTTLPLLGFISDPHILGLNGLGLHFSNGAQNHGQVQAIAERPFPQVDWEALRRDPRAVLVNSSNVPFGSWDGASNTWVVGAVFSPPVDSDVIYYVEGNAHLASLQLVKGARMTLAVRGWSAVESLSVLNVGLLPGSQQDVRIIAQEGNTIGLKVLAYSPLQLESTLNALSPTLDMATGIGLNVAGVLTTHNRLFAYSERGDVWAKVSTLTLGSTNNRMSVVARNDATIAYTLNALNANTIQSSIKPYL